MKFSIGRATAAFTASWMLLALLCLPAAHAQDADESGTEGMKTTPPITDVAGTWTGMDTQDGVSGPMTLVLTQNKKSIGGTFSLTAGMDTPAGSVNGKISGDDLTLTFHATSGTNHACTAAVLATVDPEAMPQTMSGTFLVKGDKKHCKGSGTFDLEKE